jgi:hypothetical protein
VDEHDQQPAEPDRHRQQVRAGRGDAEPDLHPGARVVDERPGEDQRDTAQRGGDAPPAHQQRRERDREHDPRDKGVAEPRVERGWKGGEGLGDRPAGGVWTLHEQDQDGAGEQQAHATPHQPARGSGGGVAGPQGEDHDGAAERQRQPEERDSAGEGVDRADGRVGRAVGVEQDLAGRADAEGERA